MKSTKFKKSKEVHDVQRNSWNLQKFMKSTEIHEISIHEIYRNSWNLQKFMKSTEIHEISIHEIYRNLWNLQKFMKSTEIHEIYKVHEIHEIQNINNFKKIQVHTLIYILKCIGHPVREEFFLSQKLQIIGVGNYPLIRMSDLLLFPLFLSISHGCSTLCCWWVLLAREQFEWINWGVLLPVSPPWLRALYVTLKTK